MAIIQTMNNQIHSMQNNDQNVMSQIISNTKDKDDSTPNIPPIRGDHLVEAVRTINDYIQDSTS